MASSKQIQFFDNLLDEKQFPPGSDLAALRTQFAGLDKSNGSDWIEKALKLPDKGEDAAEPQVPAPF